MGRKEGREEKGAAPACRGEGIYAYRSSLARDLTMPTYYPHGTIMIETTEND